ncbi:MAG TPA: TadE/TadG family type IV pilus assembly protein, partial [Gammaproteobacteria bacterium]|nr:TadE/TadG family type IV pilus assembly protein [Gammaproteobacteria bacterium]
MVEFAIVVVVFLILVLGAMEFTRMMFQWQRT